MFKYLACLRPLNLLIVFLTQVLFYYLFLPIIRFTLTENSVANLQLEPPLILPFAFITVLITASGYLINDYFDFESDVANKKGYKLDKPAQYLKLYWILVALGFVLSLVIASLIGQVHLVSIYLLAVAALFLYSARWKKQVLIGNIVVSAFSSFVVLILVFAEREYLFSGVNGTDKILNQMFLFAGFIFLISMVREIVKDIEDVIGDEAAGYHTLPIVYNNKVAQKVAFVFGFLLLLILILWALRIYPSSTSIVLGFMILFLICPTLYILISISSSRSINPRLLSKVCKLIMISGLVFIVLFRFYF